MGCSQSAASVAVAKRPAGHEFINLDSNTTINNNKKLLTSFAVLPTLQISNRHSKVEIVSSEQPKWPVLSMIKIDSFHISLAGLCHKPKMYEPIGNRFCLPNLESPARNACRIATGYMPLPRSSVHPYAGVGKVRSFDAIRMAMHEISGDDISPINGLETPERSTYGKSHEIFNSIIRRDNMRNP